MNHRPLALFLGATLICAGCQQRQVTLQQRLPSHPNSTAYDFDATVSEVKDAIKRAFAKWEDEELKSRKERVWKGGGDADDKRLLTILLRLPPGTLLWKGEGDALSKQLLTKPGNENDVYFIGGGSPLGESVVYFKDGFPLPYFADFHLHLTAVGPRRTRVEIFTYDSTLNTGVNAGWSPARGRTSLYVPVEPTTVEEYQILLRIGEQLETKGMPPLVTPGIDSAVRTITKSRKS